MGELVKQQDEGLPTKREITDQERLRLALTLALPPQSAPNDEPDEQPQPMIRFEDAAEQMGLTVPEVVAVLKDPDFLTILRSITGARADLVFHGLGVERLTHIAANGDDREALTAIKMLGQLNGSLKAGPSVEINLNFSDHYQRFEEARRSGKVISPFEIKDPSRLNLEVEDD
jgi:hypothetical protein